MKVYNFEYKKRKITMVTSLHNLFSLFFLVHTEFFKSNKNVIFFLMCEVFQILSGCLNFFR